jgi:hypothetical protein
MRMCSIVLYSPGLHAWDVYSALQKQGMSCKFRLANCSRLTGLSVAAEVFHIACMLRPIRVYRSLQRGLNGPVSSRMVA